MEVVGPSPVSWTEFLFYTTPLSPIPTLVTEDYERVFDLTAAVLQLAYSVYIVRNQQASLKVCIAYLGAQSTDSDLEKLGRL